MKLVKENLFEFHKGEDPLKNLGIGLDALLKEEDKKIDWGFSVEWFNELPKLIDIINYRGVFIKCVQFSDGTVSPINDLEEGYLDYPAIFDSPQEALNEEIHFLRSEYKDRLDPNQEPYSIAGRLKINER